MTDSPRRQRVSSGSPYEPVIGISRAVRAGRLVLVAGTAPLDAEGRTVAVGDAEAQARRCFEIVARALAELGAQLSDVVRTRVLLKRIEDWKPVARLHGEFFREARPACTVMQVVSFIDPDWLVEVEADAILS
jgi:enamine deaminase RidA (YjgF/YER057c/UK114 family)